MVLHIRKNCWGCCARHCLELRCSYLPWHGRKTQEETGPSRVPWVRGAADNSQGPLEHLLHIWRSDGRWPIPRIKLLSGIHLEDRRTTEGWHAVAWTMAWSGLATGSEPSLSAKNALLKGLMCQSGYSGLGHWNPYEHHGLRVCFISVSTGLPCPHAPDNGFALNPDGQQQGVHMLIVGAVLTVKPS